MIKNSIVDDFFLSRNYSFKSSKEVWTSSKVVKIGAKIEPGLPYILIGLHKHILNIKLNTKWFILTSLQA